MTLDASEIYVPTLGADTRAWCYGATTGEPLLLVHGFRGDHHGLEPLAREIVAQAPHLRVIVPDLPGFGETPAVPGSEHTIQLFGEWLRSFAAAIAPNGFSVLGHSFGSLVVAASIGGGLTPHRLVLINPISAPALEGPQALLTKLAQGYYWAADALPERPARSLLGNPVIVRAMSEVMAKTRDRELRAWIHDQHERYFSRFSDTSTLLQAFQASVSHTVPEYAHAFTMPTLLIAGERDDITSLPQQLALQHRVAGSTLHILPGTGHLVHYEAVSDTAELIVAFMSESTGSGA